MMEIEMQKTIIFNVPMKKICGDKYSRIQIMNFCLPPRKPSKK
jgi:hypothetical protein